MSISTSVSRFADYYRRNGLLATGRRTLLGIGRTICAHRMVVFYCDLAKLPQDPLDLPRALSTHRLKNYAELSRQDLEQMISFWHPEQAHRNIQERFKRGASLWLIRSQDSLAGYSWTIRGETIAKYYFPMAPDDVQLFDFYVFPKFRGRAILWFLVIHILRSLGDEGVARVFGDVAEWNDASLSFYKMTPFHRLGLARSFAILGHTFVSWDQDETQEQQPETRKTALPANGGKSPSIPDLRA